MVLGMGTGGLVARYALAQYTKANATAANPNPADTRLLLTHDAPHRDQNIALGLQHFSRMLGNIRFFGLRTQDVFPEFAQTIAYFLTPIMQQTLLNRTTSENVNTANTFINSVYQPMVSYAAPYRFVATSLGNECARPVNSSKKYLDFGQSYTFGLKAKLSLFGVISFPEVIAIQTKYEVSAFAAPIPAQTSANRKIASLKQVFQLNLMSFIPIVKTGYDKTANAPTSYLPVDGAPGSISTTVNYASLREYQQNIGNEEINVEAMVAEIKIPKPPMKLKLYLFFKFSEWNRTEFTTLYTALPTASALDVTSFDAGALSQKFVNSANAVYPVKSETYIAQESRTAQNLYNNFAMRFTARNARFLFNEMEGLTNLEVCSSECGGTSIYNVSGPDLLCTSELYSITGLPRGATPIWTVSPSSLGTVIQGPTPNSAYVAKISSGSATISANIVNGCPGTSINGKVVRIGGYSSSDYPVSGPTSASCNQTLTYTCPTLPGATSYTWFYPGSPWQYIDGQGTPSLTLRTPPSGSSSGQVGVRVANACDAGGSPAVRFTSVTCSFSSTAHRFEVSPNPAVSDINIQAVTLGSTKVVLYEISEVNLYDQQGTLRKHQKFAGVTKANISTSDLPIGIYVIEIVSNNTSERQRLTIIK